MAVLYETIKELCKAKGVSVSKMCLDLGMSKSIMSNLHTGRKETLSMPTLKKIADYLGVSVSVFFDEEQKEEGEKKEESEEMAELLQILRDKPETKSVLKNMKNMTPQQIKNMDVWIASMSGSDNNAD